MIYAVVMGKGGVGKTTTAAELAAQLAQTHPRVLAIDLDSQGQLSRRLGITPTMEQTQAMTGYTQDVLDGHQVEATASPSIEHLWLLMGTEPLADMADPDKRWADQLAAYIEAGQWDAVVIDTPPSIGPHTQAAIRVADRIVAPCECLTESVERLSIAEARVQALTGRGIDWFVPTLYESRPRLTNEGLDTLRTCYPGRVTNPIRKAIAVGDSFTASQPVSLYWPEAPVSEDYRAAVATITAH